MNVNDRGSVDGVLLAAGIQEMIHQLSNELAKDHRQVQRDARTIELSEGLEAARQMHEKADAVRTGAVIGGMVTMVSAVGQFDAATDFGNGADASAQADFNKFETVGKLGGSINQLFAAEGDEAEARSKSAEARSRAAAHQADEADASLRDIARVDESAKEAYQEITRTQHASMMAVLARQ